MRQNHNFVAANARTHHDHNTQTHNQNQRCLSTLHTELGQAKARLWRISIKRIQNEKKLYFFPLIIDFIFKSIYSMKWLDKKIQQFQHYDFCVTSQCAHHQNLVFIIVPGVAEKVLFKAKYMRDHRGNDTTWNRSSRVSARVKYMH